MLSLSELEVGFTQETYTVQEGNDTAFVCIYVTTGWLDTGEWVEIAVSAVETNEAIGQCTQYLESFVIQRNSEWLPISKVGVERPLKNKCTKSYLVVILDTISLLPLCVFLFRIAGLQAIE